MQPEERRICAEIKWTNFNLVIKLVKDFIGIISVYLSSCSEIAAELEPGPIDRRADRQLFFIFKCKFFVVIIIRIKRLDVGR